MPPSPPPFCCPRILPDPRNVREGSLLFAKNLRNPVQTTIIFKIKKFNDAIYLQNLLKNVSYEANFGRINDL